MKHNVWLIVALALAGCGGFGAAERGNRAYRDARYAEAVEAYRTALEPGMEAADLRYNLGTALLRSGRLDDSQRELEAALSAVEPELRRRAFYNLGNRFLREGRATGGDGARDAAPSDAASLLDAAVDAYKQSLRLAPADTAAKWNLELALRERERQRQPMPGGQRPQPPREREEPGEQEGGGGSGQDASPADHRPGRNRSDAGQPLPMTREQAERILGAIEQDERQLLSGKLRESGADQPVVRDW